MESGEETQRKERERSGKAPNSSQALGIRKWTECGFQRESSKAGKTDNRPILSVGCHGRISFPKPRWQGSQQQVTSPAPSFHTSSSLRLVCPVFSRTKMFGLHFFLLWRAGEVWGGGSRHRLMVKADDLSRSPLHLTSYGWPLEEGRAVECCRHLYRNWFFHSTLIKNFPSRLLWPHQGALMQGSGPSERSPKPTVLV